MFLYSELTSELNYYRYAKTVNVTFNEVLFIQFFGSILVICTNVYYLSIHITELSRIGTLLVYTICMCVQIYIYCWSGNEVILKVTIVILQLYIQINLPYRNERLENCDYFHTIQSLMKFYNIIEPLGTIVLERRHSSVCVSVCAHTILYTLIDNKNFIFRFRNNSLTFFFFLFFYIYIYMYIRNFYYLSIVWYQSKVLS